MRGWRTPLALCAAILLAQLFRTSDLFDVVTGAWTPEVRLEYPLLHVAFAPFTLLADYLNGGSTADLKSFGAWTLLLYVLWRLGRPRPSAPSSLRPSVPPSLRPFVVEAGAALIFLAAVGLFLWWGARWQRPIGRLVAADSSLIIFDTHSHTSASHDGRSGFGAAATAAWHQRAGFDAAFVTDHNVFGAARQWQLGRAGRPPRLLVGEELSLSGLHMIVLGNDSLIPNKPWDQSFDSSLALVRLIRGGDSARGGYVIASLPEYQRNHWGADLGRVVAAGTEGLEIWTTSPKAMDFPPARRREVIARARSLGVALFGATDMHGLGYAANVWNVSRLPGWRAMADSTLARALIAHFRAHPVDGIQVVARRRVIGETRAARAFALPLGLLTVLRGTTAMHVVSLLVWCWIPPLVRARRRRLPPTP